MLQEGEQGRQIPPHFWLSALEHFQIIHLGSQILREKIYMKETAHDSQWQTWQAPVMWVREAE